MKAPKKKGSGGIDFIPITIQLDDVDKAPPTPDLGDLDVMSEVIIGGVLYKVVRTKFERNSGKNELEINLVESK